jgi:hypothetical protein
MLGGTNLKVKEYLVCGSPLLPEIRKYENTDSNSIFYHARLGIIQFI